MAKNHKFMGLLAAFVVVMGLSVLAGTASAASADDPPGNSVTSSSTFKMTDKSASVSRGVTKGYLEVRWEFPNGWKPRSKAKCIWVTGGTNSYIDAKGQRIWKDWTGKRAYICPDPTSSTGWRKAGGPPSWEPCGNEFKPPFSPRKVKVFKGKIKVVKQFSITAIVKVRAVAYGTASATASCEDTRTGLKASATATGSGFAEARAEGRATARSRQKAINRATENALRDLAIKQMYAELAAQAVAKADAWGTASAQVSCVAVPPPGVPPSQPPPVQPPPTQPPPPKQPPARSCLILPVQGKDGMLFTATVAVSDPGAGPQGTIFWGDGASSPGLQGEHTYSAEGTYTISATVSFQQGGSASCSTTVTAKKPQPPPPAP